MILKPKAYDGVHSWPENKNWLRRSLFSCIWNILNNNNDKTNDDDRHTPHVSRTADIVLSALCVSSPHGHPRR